jgi:hypothetical protein
MFTLNFFIGLGIGFVIGGIAGVVCLSLVGMNRMPDE